MRSQGIINILKEFNDPINVFPGDQWDYPWELDNFENLMSNFLPIDHYFILPSTSIRFLLKFPAKVPKTPHPCVKVFWQSPEGWDYLAV